MHGVIGETVKRRKRPRRSKPGHFSPGCAGRQWRAHFHWALLEKWAFQAVRPYGTGPSLIARLPRCRGRSGRCKAPGSEPIPAFALAMRAVLFFWPRAGTKRPIPTLVPLARIWRGGAIPESVFSLLI